MKQTFINKNNRKINFWFINFLTKKNLDNISIKKMKYLINTIGMDFSYNV